MSDEQPVSNEEETTGEAGRPVAQERTARSASSAAGAAPLIPEDQPVSFKPSGRAASDAMRSQDPANGSAGKGRKSAVPRARRMKLSLTHVDPWSVTKVSFLLAIAVALIQVVAVTLIWLLLNSIGLFDNITQLVSTTGLDSEGMDVASILSIGTVLSATTIFSIFEIVLLTVLATIGAFLYNVVSSLVGGVHLTLGDD